MSNQFGAWVRATRKRLRISQQEIATALSITQTAISLYELGRRRFDLADAAKVLKLFREKDREIEDPFGLEEAEMAHRTIAEFSEQTGIRI